MLLILFIISSRCLERRWFGHAMYKYIDLLAVSRGRFGAGWVGARDGSSRICQLSTYIFCRGRG